MLDIKQKIKEIYAHESGIDVNDKKFWTKLNKWAESKCEEDEFDEKVCPRCGRPYEVDFYE